MKIKTQVKCLWWWKTISTTIKWEINIESSEELLQFVKKQMNHDITTCLEVFNFGYFVNITSPKPGLIVFTKQNKKVRVIIAN